AAGRSRQARNCCSRCATARKSSSSSSRPAKVGRHEWTEYCGSTWLAIPAEPKAKGTRRSRVCAGRLMTPDDAAVGGRAEGSGFLSPGQRPGLGSEIRGEWEEHDPEPDLPARVRRLVPEADSAAHDRRLIVEAASPHYTVFGGGHVFPAVQRIVGIGIEAPCQVPDVAAHLLAPARADAAWETAHRARLTDLGFGEIRPFRIRLRAPGIGPAVRATRGLLPLRFGGESHGPFADKLPGPTPSFRQPGTEGLCLVPAHQVDRRVGVAAHAVGIAGLVSASVDVFAELAHRHRVSAYGKGV